MTQGRSIRLFLVDGAPNGLLSAEIMNWCSGQLIPDSDLGFSSATAGAIPPL